MNGASEHCGAANPDEWARVWMPFVKQVVQGMYRHKRDVDDLVSEALLGLWVQGRGTPLSEGLAVTIIRCRCIDALRKRGRRKDVAVGRRIGKTDDDSQATPLHETAAPYEDDPSEAAEWVEALLAGLSENDRSVVTRHLICNESFASISKSTGQTKYAVGKRYEKVIEDLRAKHWRLGEHS